ncbi:MAG: DUF3141 domain-containing protein [Desulfobacter sp.]|nr:MAG: DUF3141 domain-containing protein [Desulfobacter sp.]
MLAFAQNAFSPVSSMFRDGYDYTVDACQRSVLFGDIIRKRGNNYLHHIKMGKPPILAFNYEVIIDGRTLERPVNHKLIRIIDRRSPESDDSGGYGVEKRQTGPELAKEKVEKISRPIVIMDPRAGHGPGIGGSKMDSQVGIALSAGHPVYFIVFLPYPESGQTIADVQRAHIRFLEEVARRHPGAFEPAIIGNCQAGWAAMLIAADRPDVTGPLVLNGSPLSYWSGVVGANPMRYRGGLFGGSWLASMCSDLGNGIFDGAHLVAGFEELNAANTFWSKQYNVYANVDTEEKRFLDFERWWGGFFFMTGDEIRFIVNNLFMGDKLDKGYLQLHENTYIHLKNLKDPILVFASKGDNITPPQQALNWIAKVYKNTEEIKNRGQVIVYLIHESIGHLGIFVSSKINRKEHREIIGCVNALDFLAPGLYEMVLREPSSKPWLDDIRVDFVPRKIRDILDMDDGTEDEQAFLPVASISKFNDNLYQEFVSPWVRLFNNDLTAELIRQSHPLRVQRYAFSDLNPFMSPLRGLAETVKTYRKPVKENNIFLKTEKLVSGLMVDALNFYQSSRDLFSETLFFALYDNPWVNDLFIHEGDKSRPGDGDIEGLAPPQPPLFKELEKQLWHKAMATGGFEEAVIRIMLAVSHADNMMNMMEYDAAKQSLKTDKRLKALKAGQLKALIKEQAALLEKDRNLALATLPDLIPEETDREAALIIAGSIADINGIKKFKKTQMLKRLEGILLPDRKSGFTYSS